MSRGKRRPRVATGISLFSLLDVLLCAMGVLIVLLAVIVRQVEAQARQRAVEAAQKAAEKAAERAADRAAAKAAKVRDAEEKAEKERQARAARQQSLDQQALDLRSQADAAAAALHAKRLSLAQLDAELAEAQRRLQQLEQQRRDLERLAKERPADELLRRQLAELEERLRQAQAILSERQRAAAAPPQELYSILPYAGRNGTPRRPIYIECRGDRVVIQPEGTELTREDFEVLGPGNPLEAAVRATVTYWGQSGQTDFYPLLLVRPEGVPAYQVAHASLKPWGREFGYELVEDDWKLAYPPADPVLAKQQQAAIDLARTHMQSVAKNERQRRRSPPVYRIGAGSLERMGSGDDDDDDDFSARGAGRGLGGGNKRGGGRGATGFGGGPNGVASQGAGATGNSPERGGFGPDAARLGGSTEGSVFTAGGNDSANNPLGARFMNASPQGLPYRSPGQAGTSTGTGTGNGNALEGGQGSPPVLADRSGAGNSPHPFGAVGTQFDRMTGDRGGQARGIADGSDGRDPRGNGNGGSGTEGREGGSGSAPVSGTARQSFSGPGGTGAMPSDGMSQMPGGNGGPTGSGNQMMPDGMPDDQQTSPTLSKNARMTPIAKKEGANWALPMKPNRGSSPIRRNVPLMVDEGAITVFVDPRTAQTLQIIRFSPDPTQITGELKDAIWRVMKDWGNPPAGFHWRPVLRTQVTQRGTARFNQLNTLLEDSGFELAGQQ